MAPNSGVIEIKAGSGTSSKPPFWKKQPKPEPRVDTMPLWFGRLQKAPRRKPRG